MGKIKIKPIISVIAKVNQILGWRVPLSVFRRRYWQEPEALKYYLLIHKIKKKNIGCHHGNFVYNMFQFVYNNMQRVLSF